MTTQTARITWSSVRQASWC